MSQTSCITETDCKNGEVRLADGTPTLGRVEICVSGVWGTVCDNFWGDDNARVVCRTLGLVDKCKSCLQNCNSYIIIHFFTFCVVATAFRYPRFGQGEGPIHLDNVQCTGEEESLLDCRHRGIGIHSCGHYEDASVLCYNSEYMSKKNRYYVIIFTSLQTLVVKMEKYVLLMELPLQEE